MVAGFVGGLILAAACLAVVDSKDIEAPLPWHMRGDAGNAVAGGVLFAFAIVVRCLPSDWFAALAGALGLDGFQSWGLFLLPLWVGSPLLGLAVIFALMRRGLYVWASILCGFGSGIALVAVGMVSFGLIPLL